jgi:hypothetical protein
MHSAGQKIVGVEASDQDDQARIQRQVLARLGSTVH